LESQATLDIEMPNVEQTGPAAWLPSSTSQATVETTQTSMTEQECLNPTVLDMSQLPRGWRIHLAAGILVLDKQ
jgi:hypothetical protein